MSELKAYGMNDPEVGDEYEMYKVSDADKVLAEKDAEINHQKYKRCLAMAKWCDAKADWYYSIGESFRNRVEFYMKWHKRWLELAEKFKDKEAK